MLFKAENKLCGIFSKIFDDKSDKKLNIISNYNLIKGSNFIILDKKFNNCTWHKIYI